jgi:hypothetical protein
MNGIQVKSYLLPENSKVSLNIEVDEIRRFNLDSATYKTLIEKLQKTYGTLLPKQEEVRTYWEDEENELIGFSSDCELQYAVDCLTQLKLSKPYETKSNLFKVYVVRNTPKSEKKQPIWKQWRKEQMEGAPEGPLIHFNVVCDNCDGSIIGNRYKCTTCPNYDLCEECKTKDVHKEHPMNMLKKSRQCPFGMPHALFNGQSGPRCQKRGDRRCRQNNPFEQFSAFSKIPLFSNSVPLVNNPEQLKNLGENLKKILDPLGIDVSYYVDNLTGDQTNKKSGEKNAEAKTTEAKDTKSKATEENTSSVMDEDIEEVVVSEPLNSKDECLSSVLTQKPTEKSIVVPSAPRPLSEEESLIDFQKSINLDVPYNAAIGALKAVSSNSGCEEAGTTSGMVDGFNLVEIDKELKIIKAIDQLNAMGYLDDGGWLTRLVTDKNGNINAVLDAITPGAPKK